MRSFLLPTTLMLTFTSAQMTMQMTTPTIPASPAPDVSFSLTAIR